MTDHPKIPVWSTAIESWRLVGRYWRELLVAGWAPAVLIVALHVRKTIWDPYEAFDLAGSLVDLVLQSAAYAILLVPWHRLVLLGEQPPRGIEIFAVHGRHLRFTVSLVLLALPMQVLGVTAAKLFGVVGPGFFMMLFVGFVGGMLSLVYIAARLSLVLPARALGHDGSFGRAWQLSAANGGRLILAAFLATMPLMFFGFVLYFWSEPPEKSPLLALFSPFDVASLVVDAAVLSLCYRFIAGLEPVAMPAS